MKAELCKEKLAPEWLRWQVRVKTQRKAVYPLYKADIKSDDKERDKIIGYCDSVKFREVNPEETGVEHMVWVDNLLGFGVTKERAEKMAKANLKKFA